MARSLAESFGIKNPKLGDEQPEPIQVEDLTSQQFARSVLNSTEYRDSLLQRILFNELPPAVEIRLMEYAWGKPMERVQIEHTGNPYDGMTLAQIAERAEVLRNILQQQADETEQSDDPQSSVH